MPGSGKQSAAIQRQIVEFLEAGLDPTTIHRRLKVGRSSIYRMKRCLQQHGTAYAPPETNKKNGRPRVMSAEQEFEIRTWLQDPQNRDRCLDDMVWFIHDRFGRVCSTTTCSKIKRKWLRVIEAEERGERLVPADALEQQVRMEAFRVRNIMPSVSSINQEAVVVRRQKQRQQDSSVVGSLTPLLSPLRTDKHVPSPLKMAGMLQHHQHQQQQQPRQQYAPQIDQILLHGYRPPQINQRLQEQAQSQTGVAHTALRQHQSGT